MEDFNTGTLPHKKYYDLDVYERRRAAKAAKRGPAAVRPCDTSDPVRCLLSLMHNERCLTKETDPDISLRALLVLIKHWVPKQYHTEALPGKSMRVQSGGNSHSWQACACWACHVSPS